MVSLITSLRSATTNVIISETGFRDFVPVAITLLQLFKNNGYFSGRVRNIFHSDIQGQTRPNGLVDFVS